MAVFLARIVIPFSRSRSPETRIRSATPASSWCAVKAPAWWSMASTRVVLPWSTWATMATLRRSLRVTDTGCESRPHADHRPDRRHELGVQRGVLSRAQPGGQGAPGRLQLPETGARDGRLRRAEPARGGGPLGPDRHPAGRRRDLRGA